MDLICDFTAFVKKGRAGSGPANVMSRVRAELRWSNAVPRTKPSIDTQNKYQKGVPLW